MSPIIDLIISIKNGYMAKKEVISVSYSSYKHVMAEKLKKLGFIESVEVHNDIKKVLTIKLAYPDGEPALTGVTILSKPGKREYIQYKKVRSVLGGLGYLFISTPKGIMTDKEAKKAKLGGELLFSLW